MLFPINSTMYSPVWRRRNDRGACLSDDVDVRDICFVVEYTSRSTVSPDKIGLAAMAETTRKRNIAHGVTGVLYYFYKTNSFYYRLEGPSESVRRILDKAFVDTRHKDIHVQRAALDRRLFGKWDLLVRPMIDTSDTDPDVLFRNTFKWMAEEPTDANPDWVIPPRPGAAGQIGHCPTCLRSCNCPRRLNTASSHRRRGCAPSGRPPVWLKPCIALDPHSPWYAQLECEYIMSNNAGIVAVVGPPTSVHLGRKVYVPPGYLNHVGDCYVGHLKVKDPKKYDQSVPVQKREIITFLPSLHYGWDVRVPKAHRVRRPAWAAEHEQSVEGTVAIDFDKSASPSQVYPPTPPSIIPSSDDVDEKEPEPEPKPQPEPEKKKAAGTNRFYSKVMSLVARAV